MNKICLDQKSKVKIIINPYEHKFTDVIGETSSLEIKKLANCNLSSELNY